jgi:hypothetical protein
MEGISELAHIARNDHADRARSLDDYALMPLGQGSL